MKEWWLLQRCPSVEKIAVQIEEVSRNPKLPCTALELGVCIPHCLRTCPCVAFPRL